MASKSADVPVKKESQAKTPVPAAIDPWAPMDALRRQIDGVFENFARGWPRGWGLDLFNEMAPSRLPPAIGAVPKVDVKESKDGYEISAELPGIDEKDVELTIDGNLLTLAGEKKVEREEKKDNYHWSERSYGSFRRSFALPDGVDADKAAAKFAKGVLTVTLPKTEKAKKQQRKIEIKSK